MKNSTAELGGRRFDRKTIAQSLGLALGASMLGAALPAFAAAPLISSLLPQDDSGGASVGTNLTLSFDQTVSAVSGKKIYVKKSADNSLVETIDVGDTARVTLSGSKATVNPSADLTYSTGYYVEIDAGAFVNSEAEAYAGIADATTWNFNTASESSLDVFAYSPAKGSTNVARSANLSITFGQCVTAVAGKNIVIKSVARDAAVETIAANDSSKVTLSCSASKSGIVTVNPASDLLFGTAYYVEIDSGAFTGNTNGASYAGVSDSATWAFSTAADTTSPSVPAGLGATTVAATQVSLLWTASTDDAGVSSYKVYRDGFLISTLAGDVTNFRDSGLTASTTYSYTVSACDAAGNCSSPSAPVSATTASAPAASDTQAPTVPTGLKAAGTSTGAIYLSWTASTDNVGVTAYRIYRGGTALAVLGNVTRYTDTGLSAGTAYQYSIAACDRAGNCSEQSASVSATTIAKPTPITSISEVVSGPNANASVGSDGSLVISTTPGQAPPTIVLRTDGAPNVKVSIPAGQPVIFSSNDIAQKITDVSGQSRFLTINRDGTTLIELASGEMQVDAEASGTTVPVTSADLKSTGVLVTESANTAIGVVKDDKSARVYIDGGKAGFAAGSDSSIAIFQGENGTIDPGGNLTQVALGSKNGAKQVPGDPLPVTIAKDSATKVPKLDGALARLDNATSLLDLIGDAIKELLGVSGQLSYDPTSGLLTYDLGGGAKIVLTGIGDVLVQLDQFAAASVSATAGGAYNLASRGIQMSLSGALGYFSDLQSVVLAIDPNGQLSLKPSGAIEVRMGGARYIGMPGVFASVPANPNPIPGFDSDENGLAVFRDHTGAVQTLYPTFLDTDSLALAFTTVDPGLTLVNNGNGTVTASALGQSFTLVPEYTIIDQPGHETDAYWEQNGTLYFHNSDQSAQGFRLQ
ncbi:MAG: hypothetical protein A3G25_16810 [Betaproteobacteria bacterium RIFCSPLOWO2_12_FULL_63_13]|nr:MAG: hypothetical protein A3G25_16810 [Betaproteobacteria bacterium RIFCSPLOWO2_12_FULL_63_13]